MKKTELTITEIFSPILSWESLIKFTHVCLVFKILHGMVPPPLWLVVLLNKAVKEADLLDLLQRVIVLFHTS